MSQALTSSSLPEFLNQLRNVTVTFTEEVVESPPTIIAIVQILSNVANTTSSLIIPMTKTLMEVCILRLYCTCPEDSYDTGFNILFPFNLGCSHNCWTPHNR